jgi:SH3-like domain-containing protein
LRHSSPQLGPANSSQFDPVLTKTLTRLAESLHGCIMHFGLPSAACLPLCAALILAAAPACWAQTGGTLQPPAHPPPQAAAPAPQPSPPAAAPRTPVQKVGAPAKQLPPVVKPHGDAHRQTPAKPDRAKAEAPKPEAAAPPPPQPTPETAEKLADPEKPDGSAPKLPRFASLRSDDVNMRVGPGSRYRIEWVYKRRDLPMEIEREFDVWRWVEDPDGNKGWVHQATLMGRRSFIVQKADATLRSDASDTAPAVATLKAGVIGRIRSCDATSDWCNVQAGGYRGYLRRGQFWGTLPNEPVGP